jgi:hypothetical protein
MPDAAKILDNFWKPHEGQIPIGKALFIDNILDIFVQAGRKFGKTDLLEYAFWRYPIENPGTENYYFAPYAKQAREILWAPRRLQSFGPREFIKSINNTEMRLTFWNDSFVKLDGSENFEAYRGITPKGLIAYDEFKDFRPEFHEAFDPNRSAHQCPLIILGTPPDRHCQYVEMAEEYRDNPKKAYFHAPTEMNPYISKDWLDDKKKELYDRGEGDVWEREYGALYIRGGAARIFPMLNESVVRPHDDIVKEIFRDRNKLQWILFADPAAASCFAVIFMAINPYSKMIYVLDEIYETDQAEMSTFNIGRRIFQKRDELHEREWRQGYDEAETWFLMEIISRFPDEDPFEPSHKAANKKDVGLSLIKDILLQKRMVVSDRCKKFFWEMDNYYKDKNGKIPKTNDHLIDCFRYSIAALNYQLEKETEYIEAKDEMFRGERLYVGNELDGYVAL